MDDFAVCFTDNEIADAKYERQMASQLEPSLHLTFTLDVSSSMQAVVKELLAHIHDICVFFSGLGVCMSLVLYSDMPSSSQQVFFMKVYPLLAIDQIKCILKNIRVDGGGLIGQECSHAAIKIAQRMHRRLFANRKCALFIVNLTDESFRQQACARSCITRRSKQVLKPWSMCQRCREFEFLVSAGIMLSPINCLIDYCFVLTILTPGCREEFVQDWDAVTNNCFTSVFVDKACELEFLTRIIFNVMFKIFMAEPGSLCAFDNTPFTPKTDLSCFVCFYDQDVDFRNHILQQLECGAQPFVMLVEKAIANNKVPHWQIFNLIFKVLKNHPQTKDQIQKILQHANHESAARTLLRALYRAQCFNTYPCEPCSLVSKVFNDDVAYVTSPTVVIEPSAVHQFATLSKVEHYEILEKFCRNLNVSFNHPGSKEPSAKIRVVRCAADLSSIVHLMSHDINYGVETKQAAIFILALAMWCPHEYIQALAKPLVDMDMLLLDDDGHVRPEVYGIAYNALLRNSTFPTKSERRLLDFIFRVQNIDFYAFFNTYVECRERLCRLHVKFALAKDQPSMCWFCSYCNGYHPLCFQVSVLKKKYETLVDLVLEPLNGFVRVNGNGIPVWDPMNKMLLFNEFAHSESANVRESVCMNEIFDKAPAVDGSILLCSDCGVYYFTVSLGFGHAARCPACQLNAEEMPSLAVMKCRNRRCGCFYFNANYKKDCPACRMTATSQSEIHFKIHSAYSQCDLHGRFWLSFSSVELFLYDHAVYRNKVPCPSFAQHKLLSPFNTAMGCFLCENKNLIVRDIFRHAVYEKVASILSTTDLRHVICDTLNLDAEHFIRKHVIKRICESRISAYKLLDLLGLKQRLNMQEHIPILVNVWDCEINVRIPLRIAESLYHASSKKQSKKNLLSYIRSGAQVRCGICDGIAGLLRSRICRICMQSICVECLWGLLNMKQTMLRDETIVSIQQWLEFRCFSCMNLINNWIFLITFVDKKQAESSKILEQQYTSIIEYSQRAGDPMVAYPKECRHDGCHAIAFLLVPYLYAICETHMPDGADVNIF